LPERALVYSLEIDYLAKAADFQIGGPGCPGFDLEGGGVPMLGSKSARWTLRRALLFGLAGGCFTTLASVAVVGVFVLCGLGALGPASTIIYLELAIFAVSFVTITLAVLVYESFCEP